MVSRRCVPASSTVSCQVSPARVAVSARVRTRMSAPRRAASSALSTTRRASSTQQSEYSKAVVNDAGLERFARRVRRQIQHARAGQALPAAQVVVHEQSDTQHPGRPQALLVRQHEAHRPDDVRRNPPQHLALGQRLPHQPEIEVLEVAQPAVDQLGRARRGAGREIAHLAQKYGMASAGGVTRQSAAVDAAADDRQVVDVLHECPDCEVRLPSPPASRANFAITRDTRIIVLLV